MPRVVRAPASAGAPLGLLIKSASDPLSGSSSSATSAHTTQLQRASAAAAAAQCDAFTFDTDDDHTLSYTTTGRKPIARSLHLSLINCRKSAAAPPLATASSVASTATTAAKLSTRIQTPNPLSHELVCATPTRVACLSPGSVSTPSSAPDSGSGSSTASSQAASEDAPLFFVAPPPVSQSKGPRAIASMLQSLPESPLRMLPSVAAASEPAAVSSLTDSVSTVELTDSAGDVEMDSVATPRVTRSGHASAPSTPLRTGKLRTPRSTPLKSAAGAAAASVVPTMLSNPCTPIRGAVSAAAASIPSFSLSALSAPSTPAAASSVVVPMSSLSSLPSPVRLPTPSPSPSPESILSSESPQPLSSEEEQSSPSPPTVATQRRVRRASTAASTAAATASPWKSASEKVKSRKRAASLHQQQPSVPIKPTWFAADVAAVAVSLLTQCQSASKSKRKVAAMDDAVAADAVEEIKQKVAEDDAELAPFTTAPRAKRSRTQQKRQEELRLQLSSLTSADELRAFAQRLIEQMQ